MRYMISAVLGNPQHPEYGDATIPFPLTREEYDDSLEVLSALEIGDAVTRDCIVQSVDSFFTVLHAMEGQTVNVDELDYLAKRLESFDDGEAEQFQAMASMLKLTDIKDFINLTFSCQQVTVIADFSDLKRVGQDHYMNLHGGSASMEELENLDGYETALLLIESGTGQITPYGVVYDNGMKLEELYKGQAFPPYFYEAGPMSVVISMKNNPEKSLWLELPSLDSQIDRALEKVGIGQTEELTIAVDWSEIPADFAGLLCAEPTDLRELNRMCAAIHDLDREHTKKLWSAVEYARPRYASQVQQLAENIDLFDFIPDIQNAAQLGRYMISESGGFDYDPNLDDFYDFEGYGRRMLEDQNGKFVQGGYIGYNGDRPLEELMDEYTQDQGMQML
nr:antirestriction protein ArdA [uncultured Oscillibacter sp.]